MATRATSLPCSNTRTTRPTMPPPLRSTRPTGTTQPQAQWGTPHLRRAQQACDPRGLCPTRISRRRAQLDTTTKRTLRTRPASTPVRRRRRRTRKPPRLAGARVGQVGDHSRHCPVRTRIGLQEQEQEREREWELHNLYRGYRGGSHSIDWSWRSPSLVLVVSFLLVLFASPMYCMSPTDSGSSGSASLSLLTRHSSPLHTPSLFLLLLYAHTHARGRARCSMLEASHIDRFLLFVTRDTPSLLPPSLSLCTSVSLNVGNSMRLAHGYTLAHFAHPLYQGSKRARRSQAGSRTLSL